MRYIYPDFYLLDCLFVSGNGGYVDDGHKLEPQQQQRQQYDQSKYQAGYDDGGYGRDYSRNVVRTGFNSLWGTNAVDLLQNRHVLPTDRVTPPSIHLVNPLQSSANCNPE